VFEHEQLLHTISITKITDVYYQGHLDIWTHVVRDHPQIQTKDKFPVQFAAYNQQDATFHNLFISVRRCTCFIQFFRPSSGAQNCTYSIRYLSDQCCYLLLAWPGWQQVAVSVWQIP